jgi:hypothetical protein
MTAVLRFISQGAPNNIASGAWNWGDVANGVRDGLLYTQPMIIGRNMLENGNTALPIVGYLSSFAPNLSQMVFLATAVAYCEIASFCLQNRVIEALTLDTFIKKLPLRIVAWYLLSSRAYMIAVNKTLAKKIMVTLYRDVHRFHKAEPYLIFLTNLTLTVLDLKNNRMRAVVALAVSAGPLLTYANILPKRISWYLNPALRMPMDMLALYYGSNKNRFWIVAGWILVPEVQNILIKGINNYVSPFFQSLKKK